MLSNLNSMISRFLCLLLLVGSTLSFNACKKDKDDPLVTNPNPNPNPTGTARIEGYVLAPNGITPIGGANVFTNANHTTTSAPSGYFKFDVPPGQYTITIETGDGN